MRAWLACACLLLAACSAQPTRPPDAVPPRAPLPPPESSIHLLLDEYADPFEGLNRRMYWFNSRLDRYLLLPVVRGYRAVMPDPFERGVRNVFRNLGEVNTFVNSVLQLKGGRAAKTLGRFLVNSTLGVAGLFDPATHLGLGRETEDLGQTLGHWGIAPGAYLVLPVLGPSNLRDTVGLGGDYLVWRQVINELGLENNEEYILALLRSVHIRSDLDFEYYQTGSAFEYELVRLLYMKYRELQVAR